VQADRIDGQITQTKAELSRLLEILCLTAEEVMEVKEDDGVMEEKEDDEVMEEKEDDEVMEVKQDDAGVELEES
jgi:hypothetical protein